MPNSDLRSDAELLAATPEDPAAFAVVYRRHVRTVLALIGRRARPADAGDLVAEVFAAALVYRQRFDPARGTGAAWLTGIALNKLAEAERRGMVEARMRHRLGIRAPLLDMTEIEPDSDASELLGHLPEDQRRALHARVLLDKPYAQIAREESVSPQAVRKRVSRALSALRSRLQEDR